MKIIYHKDTFPLMKSRKSDFALTAETTPFWSDCSQSTSFRNFLRVGMW